MERWRRGGGERKGEMEEERGGRYRGRDGVREEKGSERWRERWMTPSSKLLPCPCAR